MGEGESISNTLKVANLQALLCHFHHLVPKLSVEEGLKLVRIRDLHSKRVMK